MSATKRIDYEQFKHLVEEMNLTDDDIMALLMVVETWYYVRAQTLNAIYRTLSRITNLEGLEGATTNRGGGRRSVEDLIAEMIMKQMQPQRQEVQEGKEVELSVDVDRLRTAISKITNKIRQGQKAEGEQA